MKKKIISMLLSTALAASMLAGCGLSGSNSAAETATAAVEEASDAVEEAAEEVKEEVEEAVEEVADAASDVIPGAESDPAVTLTMAEVNPADTIVGMVDTKFKEEVERLSGGSVKIDLQLSGVLGSENVVLDSMLGGGNDIDISRISAFSLSSYGCTKSVLLSLPYTFVSRDHYWNFSQSDLAQSFLDEPEELGLGVRGLMYGEEGFRHFFSKDPVSDISDLKGMKIRVSSDPVMVGMVEGLGANATNVDFTELYSALQTGVVDAAEQPIANYQSNAFPEVAPNMILDGHTLGAFEIIISDGAWDKLTENQQKAVTEAAKIAGTYNKEISAAKEADVLAELKAGGATITEVTDVTPWQEATKAVIEANTKGQEDLYQQLLDLQ